MEGVNVGKQSRMRARQDCRKGGRAAPPPFGSPVLRTRELSRHLVAGFVGPDRYPEKNVWRKGDGGRGEVYKLVPTVREGYE